ncbi:MAG: hypothetical protein GXY26_02920 [Clostridiales bacterium]|jgi:hypothetical protein|nr:hypothetical protein [Clostridiales bacterium]
MGKRKRDKYNMAHNSSVALDSELTGLVQTPPGSDAEAQSYTELAGIPRQKAVKKNEHGHDQSLKQ